MAQSLAKILLHMVFSTKERQPFLKDKALREELHRYLGGILANLECQPLVIGGVEDHVHLLFAHSRTATVAEVVKELKRGSTVWLKTKSPALAEFAWQNGYGVFSFGPSQVEDVRAYIAGRRSIIGRFRFRRNSAGCCSVTRSRSMSGMFGIDADPAMARVPVVRWPMDSTLSGLVRVVGTVLRVARGGQPWAG
jgi:REP element-mobilizing transposase RayT